jgi:hypothetical protein
LKVAWGNESLRSWFQRAGALSQVFERGDIGLSRLVVLRLLEAPDPVQLIDSGLQWALAEGYWSV